MKADTYIQKATNVFTENRLLKFAIIVLAAAVVVNSFLVFRAIKYQRVVLIPPQMTGTVEFVQGKPTETYIKDLGRRIINLATTYSPATARAQFDELLTYYAPESYPVASKEWYSLASRVEESQVSSTFYLESFKYGGKVGKDTLELFGNSRQFADDVMIENRSKTFIIKYCLQDGRLYIIDLTEKGGAK